MDRYSTARAKGRSAYDEAVREDEELLAKYGLRLLSIEAGISFAVEDRVKGNRINPWDVIELTSSAWDVVRPLLLRLGTSEKELKEVRAQLRLCQTREVVRDAKS